MKKNKILIFIVIVTAIVAVIRTVSAQNRVKQLKREEYGGGRQPRKKYDMQIPHYRSGRNGERDIFLL